MEVIRAARRFPARTAVRAAGLGGTTPAFRVPAAAPLRPRCSLRSCVCSGAARARRVPPVLTHARLPVALRRWLRPPTPFPTVRAPPLRAPRYKPGRPKPQRADADA